MNGENDDQIFWAVVKTLGSKRSVSNGVIYMALLSNTALCWIAIFFLLWVMLR